MSLRDPRVLLNPLFHVRCSHGRRTDPLHFQRRARPLNICCSQRRGETTKWWSVKRGDSWNNPRLGKEKHLRRTKLAVSARSRRTGWAETGRDGVRWDGKQIWAGWKSGMFYECHRRADKSMEELPTVHKVHTSSPHTGSFVPRHIEARI